MSKNQGTGKGGGNTPPPQVVLPRESAADMTRRAMAGLAGVGTTGAGSSSGKGGSKK
jgi:hypothetical protein